jgi:rod shape-determining protein MreD
MPIAKVESRHSRDPLIAIIFSVVIVSVLMVYPLSYQASGWRPLFMLMVMLFWVLCQPTWCGVWFAFGTGIFMDLLLDAPLGMNALSFVAIAFVTRFMTRERRIMSFSNLWVITAIAVFVHLLLSWLIQVLAGVSFTFSRHWQPMLTTILSFPVLYYMLRKWRI